MYNICIDKIRFVWDEAKNLINQEKHGVSFEEAQTVFYDDYALLEFDEEHSELEDRFRILGLSKKGRLLIVVHCTRESESIIRLISSRKATENEKTGYDREEKRLMRTNEERDEYLEKEFDFSKAVRNPYAKKLHKKITINIDVDALDYFKDQSSESGIPYQKLMNLYLVDCAKSKKKLEIIWK